MKELIRYNTEIRYALMGLILIYFVWANEVTVQTALGIFVGLLFPTTQMFLAFNGFGKK